MNNDQQTALAMLAYALASPVVMLTHPRNSARLFMGGDYNAGHCSCTRNIQTGQIIGRNPTCAVHS